MNRFRPIIRERNGVGMTNQGQLDTGNIVLLLVLVLEAGVEKC
jgi:hypothetical protein